MLILVALALLALAVYVGVQVLSVLYGIVLPPSPPLPIGVVETRHDSPAYGVDAWEYRGEADPCSVVRFYEAGGGICLVALNQCGREGGGQVEAPAVAQCAGQTPFSIFTMHWSATIFADRGGASRLEVSREVYWIGTGPAATPQFDFGDLSSSPNASSAQ